MKDLFAEIKVKKNIIKNPRRKEENRG